MLSISQIQQLKKLKIMPIPQANQASQLLERKKSVGNLARSDKRTISEKHFDIILQYLKRVNDLYISFKMIISNFFLIRH